MVFSSINFLFLFLPILLGLYFLLPERLRGCRNLVLLLFSLYFYSYGGPRFLGLMLISIAVNYLGGLVVAPGGRGRRIWMSVTVVANLGMLGWFKYAGFLGANLNRIWAGVPVPEVVLPIGISFFTFQGMSYVLDVYRGDAAPEGNPLRVALYIALFPQLVAGPIVRYVTVADEIRRRHESMEEFTDGAVRFLFGLAKKMLLANQLGLLADQVYATRPEFLTTALAWIGAVAYTGQIYFDFSGYSDMAIGLGRMFGFHFLENFDYPYVSKSITEFWRRWHISLSTWFRDYLYIPLGGNRCSTWKHVRNILMVWTLTGLWHGAAWNFLCWGLYFGLLLLGEKYGWGKQLGRAPAVAQHLYTMLLVVVSWVVFRAETLGYAGHFLGAMAGFAQSGWSDERTTYYLLQFRWELLLAIPAAMPVKQWLQTWLEARRGTTWSQVLLLWGPKLLALGLFGLAFLRLVSSSFNPFIYFRF